MANRQNKNKQNKNIPKTVQDKVTYKIPGPYYKTSSLQSSSPSTEIMQRRRQADQRNIYRQYQPRNKVNIRGNSSTDVQKTRQKLGKMKAKKPKRFEIDESKPKKVKNARVSKNLHRAQPKLNLPNNSWDNKKYLTYKSNTVPRKVVKDKNRLKPKPEKQESSKEFDDQEREKMRLHFLSPKVHVNSKPIYVDGSSQEESSKENEPNLNINVKLAALKKQVCNLHSAIERTECVAHYVSKELRDLRCTKKILEEQLHEVKCEIEKELTNPTEAEKSETILSKTSSKNNNLTMKKDWHNHLSWKEIGLKLRQLDKATKAGTKMDSTASESSGNYSESMPDDDKSEETTSRLEKSTSTHSQAKGKAGEWYLRR